MMKLLELYRYIKIWFGVIILEFGHRNLTLVRCDYEKDSGVVALAIIRHPPERVMAKRGMAIGGKYRPRPGDTLLYFDNLEGLDNLVETLLQIRLSLKPPKSVSNPAARPAPQGGRE